MCKELGVLIDGLREERSRHVRSVDVITAAISHLSASKKLIAELEEKAEKEEGEQVEPEMTDSPRLFRGRKKDPNSVASLACKAIEECGPINAWGIYRHIRNKRSVRMSSLSSTLYTLIAQNRIIKDGSKYLKTE